MRLILITCVLATIILISFRTMTEFTVKGTITDPGGQPVAGATISEKGATNSTTTDANGDFTLLVRSVHARLVIDAVGFISQDITVGRQAMKIVLTARNDKHEEIAMLPTHNAAKQMLSRPSASTLHTMEKAVRINGTVSVQAFPSSPQARPGYYNNAGAPHMPGRLKESYNTEDYDAIVENRFLNVAANALSTFSIDVDAAAYSNVRRYLRMKELPPAGSVRIEEMINYFRYDYPQPANGDPFTINTEISECPWNTKHRLVSIGLQGKKIPMENLPASNLVFLIDVSGSMMPGNKLPLVKSSMKLLVDQLRGEDKVAIVVYAGSAGLVLPPTSGDKKIQIKEAIDQLEAGGSTAGGEGIKLAYTTAKENYLGKGNNRVILCTDGDFNVGTSSDAELERMIEEERRSGVFLTVLGYGMGNYKDNKMQKLADKGNGNHAYIDGIDEARKVLVSEFGGTLFAIAKDVKLQVEFNPAKVQSYRLIGYENRMLSKEDFNNDRKDAGELGSGHTVTALYEVIPVGIKNEFEESVDALKYQESGKRQTTNGNEIMNIKLRYKKPDGDMSSLIEHPVIDRHILLGNTSDNFRFAASVAEFGMLLRNSEFKQSSSFANVFQLAKQALGKDDEGYRSEFLQMVKSAEFVAKGKQDPAEEVKAEVIGRKK